MSGTIFRVSGTIFRVFGTKMQKNLHISKKMCTFAQIFKICIQKYYELLKADCITTFAK